MTSDERLAVQRVVVEQLQRDAQEHPTLLIDTLLSGDGWHLVHGVLMHQETAARVRADTLRSLLQSLMKEHMPQPAAPPPPPMPPPSPPLYPYPGQPAPSVPRPEE